MKRTSSIWNKKCTDLTLGESMKVAFWTTIISIVLGCLPLGVAALMERADEKRAQRSAPADDEEEEETSD